MYDGGRQVVSSRHSRKDGEREATPSRAGAETEIDR